MEKWIRPYFKDSKTYKKNSPESELEISFTSNIKLSTKNYHEALIFNAKAVAESFTQPFDVLLSGGIDSEVMVRINKDLGIKQNVYTIKFENDYNKRDVDSAIEICKSLSIPLKIIDFNLKRFFENDAASFYNMTYMSRVEILPRLAWHDFFDNTLVFGDGEPYWKRILVENYNQKSKWVMCLDEYEFAQDLYSAYRSKDIVGSWYTFTPDIIFNFMKTPLINNLINDQIPGKLSSWSSRVPLHRTIWPNIKDKIKLVGYEANESAGTMPDFMIEFRDKIMKNVTNTTIELSKDFLESLCDLDLTKKFDK